MVFFAGFTGTNTGWSLKTNKGIFAGSSVKTVLVKNWSIKDDTG
jgi:hypothetical protein